MNPHKETWAPCSPGIIHETASVSLGRRALLKLMGGAAIVCALVVGTLVGLLLSGGGRQESATFPGLLACTTVRENLNAYVREEMTPELKQRITVHLRVCAACKESYNRHKDGVGCCPKDPTLKPCSTRRNAPCP